MAQEMILNRIDKELNEVVDPRHKKDNSNSVGFRKTGIRTPIVRKIAKKLFKEIKDLKKQDILNLCEELLKQNDNIKTTIAIQWASQLNLSEEDFKTLERWLDKYINNWGKIDDMCLNVLSHFIVKCPKFKDKVKTWTTSRNMWKRRASAVAFIQGKSWLMHDKYLPDVFEVALDLIHDKEDLVQKGFGWMLKIAAETHQEDVFNFVMQHKREMPRTSLRYAIEKMPKNRKKKAMER